MSYKTILVHLPTAARAKEMLKTALALAEAQDAHLIGLHVVPRVPVSFGMVEAQIPTDVIERQTEALRADAEAAEQAFAAATRGYKANVEWRCDMLEHSNITATIVEESLTADLVIVSQDEPDPFGLRKDVPSAVVYNSGRPTIILPRNGVDTLSDGVIRRVTIAWNRSREAARAVFDALPILSAAEAVEIVCVDPPFTTFGEDIANVLARHHVKCELKPVDRAGRPVGDAIREEAEAFKADLIVMGCYGHSSLRESLFGGATYDVLDDMKRAVFMTH